MDKKDVVSGVKRLSRFVKRIAKAKIFNKEEYRAWAKKHESEIADIFCYTRKEGMPSVTALVTPFFHPTLPLVGFNYTQNAHNTLYKYESGWTIPLRLSRGIVFDRTGILIALPFPKFFNYGEHAETTALPDEPFEATAKYDGHLGIIFFYEGDFVLTTRGSFGSHSAVVGGEMLARYVRTAQWRTFYPDNVTLLVEIIHPVTRVHVEYDAGEEFVAIGAFNRNTLKDYSREALASLAGTLTIPIAERWAGNSIKELVSLVNDSSIHNKEGYVVRFESGLRAKFKYKAYIGKMVEEKLSYTYLMNRCLSGNLERMLDTLSEEIRDAALLMLGKIFLAISSRTGESKEKWQMLYSLMPDEKRTSYYKQVCRSFVKWFCNR